MQRRVFPLRILAVQPVDLGTLRCQHIGTGEDGLRYYLKFPDSATRVPAAEYICTELALTLRLAVPLGEIAIIDATGQPVFASREEGGVLDRQQWLSIIFSKHPPPGLAAHFSAWLAFDLFIHNPDRHTSNFLMRSAGSSITLMGFDFSEAWHVAAWPMPNRLHDCNTLQARKILATRFPLDGARFDEVLDTLGSLPDDWLRGVLSQLPGSWLSDTLKRQMALWWVQDRQARIDRLKQEKAHGRYI